MSKWGIQRDIGVGAEPDDAGSATAPMHYKCCAALMLGATMIFLSSSPLQAQAFTQATHLINVSDDSGLSGKVKDISRGGYELSDGTPVTFERWYTSKWTDISLTWMTEVNRNFGIYWGISTGESGEKYRIDPGFRIGFLLQTELTRNSTVSFSATAVLGGMLTESTCIADYGDIGGIQTVNCRLAASVLPPAETLKQLFNDRPLDQMQVILRYRLQF